MTHLILIWLAPLLIVGFIWLIIEIDYRKQVKSLDREFEREARRINALEDRILNK